MNNKHIPYSFRHLACILLLLVYGTIGATGQELWEDSVFTNVEMEDSLGMFTIKSVENKKELLKQCMKRLGKDLNQRHSRRQYLFKISNYDTPESPSVTASQLYTVKNDNGLQFVEFPSNSPAKKEWGDLQAEAPYPLTSQDSSNLRTDLFLYCSANFELLGRYEQVAPNFGGYVYMYSNWDITPTTYKEILYYYDVEAFSISDDSGRGVYRIDLVQRKIIVNETTDLIWFNPSYIIRLYFDLESLRLIQHKGGTLLQNGNQKYYKHDYGVENDSPILTHSQSVVMKGKEVLSKFSVQLIKDE